MTIVLSKIQVREIKIRVEFVAGRLACLWFLIDSNTSLYRVFISIYRIHESYNPARCRSESPPIDLNSERKSRNDCQIHRSSTNFKFLPGFRSVYISYTCTYELFGYTSIRLYEIVFCKRLKKTVFLGKIKAKKPLVSPRIIHECDAGRFTTGFYTRVDHVTLTMEKQASAHALVNVYTCIADPPPHATLSTCFVVVDNTVDNIRSFIIFRPTIWFIML